MDLAIKDSRCLSAGYSVMPVRLTPVLASSCLFITSTVIIIMSHCRMTSKRRGKKRLPLKSREWIMAKKERRKRQGRWETMTPFAPRIPLTHHGLASFMSIFSKPLYTVIGLAPNVEEINSYIQFVEYEQQFAAWSVSTCKWVLWTRIKDKSFAESRIIWIRMDQLLYEADAHTTLT